MPLEVLEFTLWSDRKSIMNGYSSKACLLIVLSLQFIAGVSEAYYPADFGAVLKTIVFGSCNREDLPQDFWPAILDNQPDLWIWDGDNIYGDSTDQETISKKYTTQFFSPEYKIFRMAVPIIGTWDDHDFGENNSGKWFAAKEMTQRLALDFLEEPENSLRRDQKGIYASYSFGPEGKMVKLMLVDNRYHADHPGPKADLLGIDQWVWLENELLTSRAQVNLIVSGTQVIPEDHPYEKWANFPKSRKRLLDFIRKNRIPGVIFLSGDRHIHEFSLKQDEETLYPLIDFTSSGMTHYFKEFTGEPNRYRYGKVYAGTGFGQISIDWEQSDPAIKLQIKDMQNRVMEELEVSLSDLSPRATRRVRANQKEAAPGNQ